MDLTGRTAVVTGAGTGIGRAIALGLSHAGAAVEGAFENGKEIQRGFLHVR